MGRHSGNGNEKDPGRTERYIPGHGLYEKCCNSQSEMCFCPRKRGIPDCRCNCNGCDCWAFQ